MISAVRLVLTTATIMALWLAMPAQWNTTLAFSKAALRTQRRTFFELAVELYLTHKKTDGRCGPSVNRPMAGRGKLGAVFLSCCRYFLTACLVWQASVDSTYCGYIVAYNTKLMQYLR